MARHTITNRRGEATPYFWSDKHVEQGAQAVVFRKAEDGIKKMRGVHFDCNSGKVVKKS